MMEMFWRPLLVTTVFATDTQIKHAPVPNVIFLSKIYQMQLTN